MLDIFLMDAGRHRNATGYGASARSLIRTLSSRPDVNLTLQSVVNPWEIDERAKESVIHLVRSKSTPDKTDIVLQICPPNSFKKVAQKSIGLTYCDTSNLPREWIANLKNIDAIIAPSRYNYDIYKNLHSQVFLAQQGLCTDLYKPHPRFRTEGVKEFTFICISSYSFRKGSDLLIDAFFEEFSAGEAHLHFHVQEKQVDACVNHVFKASRTTEKPPHMTITSSKLSDAWMARLVNRSDCFVLPTRGEGWGLPICEALLCEKPVIAPYNSALQDYLNPEFTFMVESSAKAVDEITDQFGLNFKSTYEKNGINYAEPDYKSLKKAMREAHTSSEEKRLMMGQAGRAAILNNHTELLFGQRVYDALLKFRRHIRIKERKEKNKVFE